MFFRKFRLFRLWGFDVHIDISWFFVAALIMLSLAVTFFPARYPNLDISTYSLMAAIAAIAFFASIIIHEFCHSLVARHYGMPMKGITLWMLGGVAEMSEEPSGPKAEFLMAAAGPLASLAIAGGCYYLSALAVAQEWNIIARGVLEYLWRINIILILFNLIPAFPLDGGRLLRAVLWGWSRKLRWATRISSGIGRAFGLVLMVLGVFAFLSGSGAGGLWYFIIGLFIRFAAQASYNQLLVQSTLKDVPIEKIMKGEVISVGRQETIETLVNEYFYQHQHRLFPVEDATGRLVGSVRLSAVREIPREQWPQKRVEDIMDTVDEKNTIASEATVLDALKAMNKSKSRKLVVARGGKAEGIVSMNDILRFVSIRLEIDPELIEGEVEAGQGTSVQNQGKAGFDGGFYRQDPFRTV